MVWNPWHGCWKCSEGCEHCYVFEQDKLHGRDGSKVTQSSTYFQLPLKKDRKRCYRIPSGSTVRVCMSSDFFLEPADAWRERAWEMIRFRSDVQFRIMTRRVNRIRDCLPADWGDGWENVSLEASVENQRRAEERVEQLLAIPAKKRGIVVAPFLEPVNLEPWLAGGRIQAVTAEGESGEKARPLYFDWIRDLHGQCERQQVPLDFRRTGSLFVKDGKTYRICRAYQKVQARRSGLQYPPLTEEVPMQRLCAACPKRDSCGGCRWCAVCEKAGSAPGSSTGQTV